MQVHPTDVRDQNHHKVTTRTAGGMAETLRMWCAGSVKSLPMAVNPLISG